MKDDLLGAVSFLTIFGKGSRPSQASRFWFSIAGVIVGLLAGLTWHLLDEITTAPLLVAAIVVLVVVVVTGAIHFDGLADAADGLLAHLERERRLVVMSGPEVGAFGVVAVVMALILMSLSLSVLKPNVLLLVGVMSLSRGLVALVVELFPYAKRVGIVSEFNASVGISFWASSVLAAEALASSAVIVISVGVQGLLIPSMMCVVQLIVALRSKALIGGYTGDVLGASIVATETVALVIGALMQR